MMPVMVAPQRREKRGRWLSHLSGMVTGLMGRRMGFTGERHMTGLQLRKDECGAAMVESVFVNLPSCRLLMMFLLTPTMM